MCVLANILGHCASDVTKRTRSYPIGRSAQSAIRTTARRIFESALIDFAAVARVFAIANQKGGVAKTTTTQTVGLALADLGERVLLVDLDPQACLTFALGLEPEQVSLDARPDATPVLDAASDPETPRVYLHLEDVETEATPGVVWEVRIDPDGKGGAPEEAVGAISFFGRGHVHGGDPGEQSPGVHGERFIFDITDAVQELETAGRWDERRLTVSFHPALPDGHDEQRRQRAEFEMGIIAAMGFCSYFLVVADFIMWAKNNGIRVGPGRGSAAGGGAGHGAIPFSRAARGGRPSVWSP